MAESIEMSNIIFPIIQEAIPQDLTVTEEPIEKEIKQEIVENDQENEQEGNNTEDNTDYLGLSFSLITMCISKMHNVTYYSFDTTNYSRRMLYIISFISIISAVAVSVLTTASSVADIQHIFTTIAIMKFTHIIISIPSVKVRPTMNQIKVYIIISMFSVVSISALFMFQPLLSFPIQTLGEVMNFIPIILLRPINFISLKLKDLTLGTLAMMGLLIFVILSNTNFMGFMLFMIYIIFDALVLFFQNDLFIQDNYYSKLLFTSIPTFIIFSIMSFVYQNDIYLQSPLLCISLCLSSDFSIITSSIILKNTKGKTWITILDVSKQVSRLLFSYLILKDMTTLQLMSAFVVVICICLHQINFKNPIPKPLEKVEAQDIIDSSYSL